MRELSGGAKAAPTGGQSCPARERKPRSSTKQRCRRLRRALSPALRRASIASPAWAERSNQGVDFAKRCSHHLAVCFGLVGLEPVPEIAVALARRTSRAFGPTVHPAPASAADRRLPAGVTSAGLGSTAPGFGHIRQSSRNIRLTHGVVCHFSRSPSPSPFPGALTIPTTPWAPEWMWTCRTSTVCLFPRRCRSRACDDVELKSKKFDGVVAVHGDVDLIHVLLALA